jgi:hypothetical protein
MARDGAQGGEMMETLLAILATVSMLSAAVMAAFAWKLNSDWSKLVQFIKAQEKNNNTSEGRA